MRELYLAILEDEIPDIKPPDAVVKAMDKWWGIKYSIGRGEPIDYVDVRKFKSFYEKAPHRWQEFLLERAATITKQPEIPEAVRQAFFTRSKFASYEARRNRGRQTIRRGCARTG